MACGLAVLLTQPWPAHAQTNVPELKVLKTLKIGGSGRWDCVLVDPDANRLYVTRSTHLQVIDCETGTVVGDIDQLQGAHGTAVVADRNLGFVTSGRENAVVMFNLKTLKVLDRIKTQPSGGQNPDAILYDPASKKVFVSCGGGDALVIDPANPSAPSVSIPCGGKLEFGVADDAGHVFINNEDKSEIEVIDTTALKLTDHWPVAPAEHPTGLALDARRHRLFSTGGNQKMAMVDSQTGKLLGTVPIGRGVDGCEFDPKLGVAVCANGADGTVTVVHEDSPGKFSVVQTLPTLKSGRTIANNPKTSQFFIPATLPAEGDSSAPFGVITIGPAN
jgi:DNA-binding beta-propeller fold protein YncE